MGVGFRALDARHRDWNHMKCLRKPHPGEGLGGHLPSDPGKELLAPEGWLASNMEKPRLEVNGRIHSRDKSGAL